MGVEHATPGLLKREESRTTPTRTCCMDSWSLVCLSKLAYYNLNQKAVPAMTVIHAASSPDPTVQGGGVVEGRQILLDQVHEVIKKFMLNSAEHESLNAHKYNITRISAFSVSD